MLLALACGALAFAPEALHAGLALDRQAVWHGQFWRLWSAHLVHFSTGHALASTLGLIVGSFFVERQAGARFLVVSLALGALLVSLGLLAFTAFDAYRGASGLAALLGTQAGMLLWQSHPRQRRVLALLATAYAGKMLLEAVGMAAAGAFLPPAVDVAWQAHGLGVLAGAALLGVREVLAQSRTGLHVS